MKKQSPDYSSLARLTVVQQLRSYGIKIKHWNCRLRPEPERGSAGPQGDGKVFGTPLHMLPQTFVPDYGNIPKFLVDVCKYLEQHVHTEGLFRKSGSVVRLKLLKARLDSNEDCLSDAPPCDVAGILKQFFRELPEPILHTDLHDALFKAQHLGSDDERTFATMLISCLLPDSTIHTLQYFLRFLHAVSMRSDSNRMDSSNLALIFAPNLLQSNEDSEKISASTEKKLRAQAAVVRTLIDQAAAFGVVPDFLLEKIPGMLGVDEDTGPARTEDGEGDSPGERKRRRRRSVGDFVSGALNKFKTNRTPSSTPQTERTVFGSMVTPLILTPSTKRKLPLDSVQGVSSKKRRAFKHNLMFDRIPGGLFGSTPASASCTGSPCFSLETSQSSLSPSVSSGNPLSSSGNRRKSKRYDSRKVQRVESGKTGCFSPRITRKEMVRRSLRLRFSLGKSNKDLNILNVFPSTTRSENIGLRLANSQEMNSVSEIKVDLGSSPIESPFVSAGLKKICKSEEYLLTPKQSDGSSHCISWTGPCTLELDRPYDEGTPLSGYQCATNCFSEPFLVTGKPPAMPQRSILGYCKQSENPKNDSLCEEEESRAQYTAMRITKAFTESGSDLHKVVGGRKPLQQNASKPLAESILETEAITQVSLKEANERFDNPTEDKCISRVPGKEAIVETSTEGCLLEPSIKDPVIDRQTGSLQMITKDKADNTVDLSNTNPSMQVCTTDVRGNVCNSGVIRSMSTSCPSIGDVYSDDHIQIQQSLSQESFLFPGPDQDLALESSSRKPSSRPRRSSRVSEQIHHFNKLSLNDCSSGQKLKSPLKFQRTPVRQSVRRINSISSVTKPASSREGTADKTGVPVAKSLSYDGSLPSDHVLRHSSHPPFSKPNHHVSASHKHFAVAAHSETIGRIPKHPLGNRCCNAENTSNSLKSVLEDLTNRDMQETICKKNSLSASAPNVSSVERVSRRERIRYRGSPRNPITSVTLLPSTKPLEL